MGPSGHSEVFNGSQLLAKARYNNIAEAPDELSFRQGDVVTVVQKDFNKQVDWWLCELRGKRGMVPANYFEVFHDHDSTSYDIPRPSSKGSRSSSASQVTTPLSAGNSRPISIEETDAPLYDFPPPDVEITDRDYDLPPSEGYETYDRPPSSARLSPMGSTRSSVKSMNRMSTTSSVASSTCIYDHPPDLLDVYDFPKAYSSPVKGFEEEEKYQGSVLQAIDISSMLDEDAEEMLRSYRQAIATTESVLFNCAYGPDAYWGTDNKAKRLATLKATITAVKHFDKSLLVLLQFGKGVVNKLEYVSDANFKKKYYSAFKVLLHYRNDILGKLEEMNSEIDTITSTIKSLLEITRTVPRAVTEFTVLVQANKAILFKTSNKSSSNLPVITKNEVKSRPLPELPPQLLATQDVHDGDDYAIPMETPVSEDKLTAVESNLDLGYSDSTINRRNPNDRLPPLPFATLTRQGKPTSPMLKQKMPENNTPAPSLGGGSSPYASKSTIQTVTSTAHHTGEDYDEVEKQTRERSVVMTSRPSIASMGSNSSLGGSPTHLRMRRHGSLSSCSSSDDLNHPSGLRRVNSADLLDSPYGRPNGGHHQRQISSPQPLKMEEKLILDRFAKQFDLILPGLRDAMELLLECLKDKEPPKGFVTKSKLTVVAAYKLVYVADALSQKILHTETKNAIMTTSNELTEGIKNLVTATKTAALQYPNVKALDTMGGNIKLLYPYALDLVNVVKSKANMPI